MSRQPLIIGISGGSGSGKTTLAERLRDRLKPNATVISHDDYYKNLPAMTREEAAVYDFDSPDALDTYLLVEHLRALKDGLPARTPSYDFATHARVDGARLIDAVPAVLVEGLFILCDHELAELFDLVVYVDVAADVRALRRIERDCRERGTDLTRAIGMYLSKSRPAHETHVEPFKDRADIVITDALDERALEAIARRIEAMQDGA